MKMNNEKRLVEMCDELLKDWFSTDNDKSKKAWKKLMKDTRNE
jgi:hypothetical protein